jgi:hypothetical protein
MRLIIAGLLLLSSLVVAHALGLGKLGVNFGKEGASSKRGTVTPQPTGDILMVDGASLILQTDSASFICRAGGC